VHHIFHPFAFIASSIREVAWKARAKALFAAFGSALPTSWDLFRFRALLEAMLAGSGLISGEL
jgi:hypothetical protein